MNKQEDREELLRLREENLKLREAALGAKEGAHLSSGHQSSMGQVVNVKQVNESFLSGCVGFFAFIFIMTMLLGQCSG